MKLTKLINSQISVNNKSGVGFDSQMNENELHDCHLNKGEVFESASDSSVNEIEEENGLEGDEEGLVDVLVKLETSYGELDGPCDAATMKGRKRKQCAIFNL
ncbi:hypothetical protein Tco_1004301 [Tanacetum coccineum]|uniref:Uncharacterized protein n=1 Tax=Tanacetum coccineum TaxID=301880 RepID=A0ABQ5FCY4_9ASTR